MIKENVPALRAALADLTSAVAQTDSVLLGYDRVNGFFSQNGETMTAGQETAVMTSVQDGASAIQTAFNTAVAIFTATEPV